MQVGGGIGRVIVWLIDILSNTKRILRLKCFCLKKFILFSHIQERKILYLLWWTVSKKKSVIKNQIQNINEKHSKLGI